MAYRVDRFRVVELVSVLACVLMLANCQDDAEREFDCTRVNGVWHVSFEGEGYNWIDQTWTINQNNSCDVSIAASPPNDYGPLGGSDPGRGSVGKGDIWARWEKPVENPSCVNVSFLRATVTRNTISGTLDWTAGGGYGGSCWLHGSMTLSVNGSRE